MSASRGAHVDQGGLFDAEDAAEQKRVDDEKRKADIERAAEWEIDSLHPGGGWEAERPATTERCYPTVESRTLDAYSDESRSEHRGACLGCDWKGPARPSDVGEGENAAVEDAHDHAWPGWRDLPFTPDAMRKQHQAAMVGSTKQQQKWAETWRLKLEEAYPSHVIAAGFASKGAPIRTRRYGIGSRHVPGYSPFGGYDLCGEIVPEPKNPD